MYTCTNNKIEPEHGFINDGITKQKCERCKYRSYSAGGDDVKCTQCAIKKPNTFRSTTNLIDSVQQMNMQLLVNLGKGTVNLCIHLVKHHKYVVYLK